MTESIAEALTSLTGNDYLTLFLLSAIPLTELRGALIIMGGMPEVNRALGTLCCIAGSAAIVLPVILLVRPVINRLKENERLAAVGKGIEANLADRAKSVHKVAKKGKGRFSADFGKFLGLFVFVAIPLPMTGAWTGAAIGGMLDMPVWKAALAVVLGNAAASLVLLALLAFVPGEYIDILLLAFAALAVALFASWVLMRLHARRRRKKETAAQSAEAESNAAS